MKQALMVDEILGHKIYYTHIGELKVFIYDRLVKFDNGTPYVELPMSNTTFKKLTEKSILVYPTELEF